MTTPPGTADLRAHIDADHAVMVQLGIVADAAVQMLEHINMDTDEDRELHARAVGALRGQLDELAAKTKEANPAGDINVPAEAVQAAAEAIRHEWKSSRDFSAEESARAALEAAAPVLAEAVAQKILAHMEAHGPAPEAPGVTRHEVLRRAWLRHFSIAARVAAGAFYTADDLKRLAAEAIERGDFIACNIPEVPDVSS